MMKQALLMVCLMIATGAMAQTETTQKVTVGGTVIDKTVSKITFDGDNVVLGFTDQTTQTADMEQVSISFVYTSTGIGEQVRTEVSDSRKIYNLNGQYIGKDRQGLSKGIYIVNGQKVIIQ